MKTRPSCHPPAIEPAAAHERELELKFEVPAAQAEAVRQALGRCSARQQALEARYHDTADGRLASHGIALRLRCEDGAWMQTLKAPDERGAGRLEHNVAVTAHAGGVPPALDLSRHDGSAAGDALRAALGGDIDLPLEERFRTEVVRLSCEVAAAGARVELAFDRGMVCAGAAALPLHELEFELKEGDAAALAAVAGPWVARHGLWLQHDSKAARGNRLRREGPDAPAPVVKAAAPRIASGMARPEMLRAIVHACLAQIVPNASAVAGGSADPEHVHQLRVGLRRLRTAIRELAGLAPDAPLAAAEPALADASRRLGAIRDRQAVLEALLPRLLEAGAPHVTWAGAPSAGGDAGAIVRSPAFQAALLDLLGFALSADASRSRGKGRDRQRRLQESLQALHDGVVRDARRFEELSEPSRHRARKRLKRLRYLAEFAAPLYGQAEVERYLDGLRPAQDELGRHNDHVVAREAAQEAARRDDPGAHFAVDWLERRLEKSQRRSLRALRRAVEAPPFWKGKAKPRRGKGGRG